MRRKAARVNAARHKGAKRCGSTPAAAQARLAAKPRAPIRRSSGAARQPVPRRTRPMHHEAKCHRPDARPRLPRAGTRAARGTGSKSQRRCRRDARKTREWASVPHGASRRTSRNRARGSRASAAAPGLFACFASIGLHLPKTLLALPRAAGCCHNHAAVRARRRPVAPLSSPGEPHRHRQDPGRPKPHGPTIPIPPPDRTTPRSQPILAARQKPHVPIQPRVEPHRDQEHGPAVAGQPLVRTCPNATSLRHPIPSNPGACPRGQPYPTEDHLAPGPGHATQDQAMAP